MPKKKIQASFTVTLEFNHIKLNIDEGDNRALEDQIEELIMKSLKRAVKAAGSLRLNDADVKAICIFSSFEV